MCSSLQFCCPSLVPSKLRCNPPPIRSNPLSYSRITNCRQVCSLASSPRSKLEFSWIETEGSFNGEFGGWFVGRKHETGSRNGVPKFVLAGVGASVTVLLAAFTYFSFSKKGLMFKLSSPFVSLHEMLISSKSRKFPVECPKSTMLEVNQASETKVDDKSDKESDLSNLKEKHKSALGENKRIVVPVADSIQQEALDVLKKLKIIENDAFAEELCTRRDYVRWLVKANCMLERNPKHKIVPMNLIAGSTITAFDDVSTNDPDFWCIQAIGDAGITLSKLSTVNSSVSDISKYDERGKVEFSPESFISRFDMVNWKAMLEYPFNSGIEEQILRMKVGILDLHASRLDGSPQLLMDLMAGDKSIVRRVFGNIRRLQPDTPVTKAQAAVALSSGRMAETIKSEVSRLEAEHQAILAEMEETRTELIRRGDIQMIWEEMLNKEKEHELEVVKSTHTGVALPKEKCYHSGMAKANRKEPAVKSFQVELSNLEQQQHAARRQDFEPAAAVEINGIVYKVKHQDFSVGRQYLFFKKAGCRISGASICMTRFKSFRSGSLNTHASMEKRLMKRPMLGFLFQPKDGFNK